MRWFWEERGTCLAQPIFRYLEEKFLNKTYFDSLAYQNITIRSVDWWFSKKIMQDTFWMLLFHSRLWNEICLTMSFPSRYRAIKAPFSRQMSFAGASRVLRVLGKKTTRAKESLLSKLGMIRSRTGMAERPKMARQQSAWVERDFKEVEEGEEEDEDEEEKDTRWKYKQQKSCHF